MAYAFAGASNQHLTCAAPVASAPLTVAAWFWVNSTSGNQAIATLTAGNTAQRFLLYTAGGQVFWFVNDTGFSQVSISAGLAANTWHHACAVESATNSRVVYANGTAGSASTGTRSPASVDEMYVGIDRLNNSFSFPMTGRVAEVGVWSAALTAAEVRSLSQGVACRLVRPQSLVFYAPLIRSLQDLARNATITNGNSATVEVHPRIYE
jgi:hypothetical protein